MGNRGSGYRVGLFEISNLDSSRSSNSYRCVSRTLTTSRQLPDLVAGPSDCISLAFAYIWRTQYFFSLLTVKQKLDTKFKFMKLRADTFVQRHSVNFSDRIQTCLSAIRSQFLILQLCNHFGFKQSKLAN
jgi:hypothetical protein